MSVSPMPRRRIRSFPSREYAQFCKHPKILVVIFIHHLLLTSQQPGELSEGFVQPARWSGDGEGEHPLRTTHPTHTFANDNSYNPLSPTTEIPHKTASTSKQLKLVSCHFPFVENGSQLFKNGSIDNAWNTHGYRRMLARDLRCKSPREQIS